MAITGVISFPLGEFLKYLREKRGISLKDVEKATGIPNAYLSQLETGTRKKLPSPERLRLIADYYNVTMQELLKEAGYLQEKDVEETYEQKTEKAFAHIVNDPDLKSGVRIDPKQVSLDIKRFVVELHGMHVKKSFQLAKPYVEGIAYHHDTVKKVNWKTDDVIREEHTSGGKKFIRYRVKVTCIETEGRKVPRSDEIVKGTEKIIQKVSGEGEFSKESSTIQGYEASILMKATRNALKNTLSKLKNNSIWSASILAPWFD